jgi:hypothetical protein
MTANTSFASNGPTRGSWCDLCSAQPAGRSCHSALCAHRAYISMPTTPPPTRSRVASASEVGTSPPPGRAQAKRACTAAMARDVTPTLAAMAAARYVVCSLESGGRDGCVFVAVSGGFGALCQRGARAHARWFGRAGPAPPMRPAFALPSLPTHPHPLPHRLRSRARRRTVSARDSPVAGGAVAGGDAVAAAADRRGASPASSAGRGPTASADARRSAAGSGRRLDWACVKRTMSRVNEAGWQRGRPGRAAAGGGRSAWAARAPLARRTSPSHFFSGRARRRRVKNGRPAPAHWDASTAHPSDGRASHLPHNPGDVRGLGRGCLGSTGFHFVPCAPHESAVRAQHTTKIVGRAAYPFFSLSHLHCRRSGPPRRPGQGHRGPAAGGAHGERSGGEDC